MPLGPSLASFSAFLIAPFMSPLLMHWESQGQRWTPLAKPSSLFGFFSASATVVLGVCL